VSLSEIVIFCGADVTSTEEGVMLIPRSEGGVVSLWAKSGVHATQLRSSKNSTGQRRLGAEETGFLEALSEDISPG
jgi:hypothetical protein